MHAKPAAVFFCLVGLLVSGCATQMSRMNHVHYGMTKDELITQLGRPDSAKVQGNAEYLTYYMSSEANARPQPYMIRLIDAKVESFGRFISLPDGQNRGADGAMALGVGAIMPYDMNMDTVTQLQQLKALEDQGVLTKEEAQRAKDRLLTKVD